MKKHLTLLATAALTASPLMAQDLTVTSFGGAYGAAQMEHMIQPYMDASGVNVLFEDYGGGVAEMKAQVEAGNILWDVVDIEVIDLERACAEGYLEVIDQSVLPAGDDGVSAADDFIPEALANEVVSATSCGPLSSRQIPKTVRVHRPSLTSLTSKPFRATVVCVSAHR